MKTLALLVLMLSSNIVHAESCRLSIDRTACPGKETEAFAPYNGLNPTWEQRVAANQSQCDNFGVLYSKILRRGIIAKITVTPTFAGNSLAAHTTEAPCGLNFGKK